MIAYDTETAMKIERGYTTPEMVHQRHKTLKALRVHMSWMLDVELVS